MSIQLRLDAAALAALYPAGTPAFVDLQNAVVAEFMKKHFKTALIPEQVMLTATAEARKASEQAMKELGVLKDAWGNLKLSQETKNLIAAAARDAVQAEIKTVVATIASSLGGMIKHDTQAAVNRLVDAEIREAVKARVAAVMTGLATTTGVQP